ncbi:3-methyl-2-oxobutanoate hydroxymethyltransferase [Natronospora cellulosivora (SeqCode)]
MKRKSIKDIQSLKEEGKKISMITAYDYYSAKFVDQLGTDMILVGDSLGMVIQGKDDTLSVTLDDMLYHTSIVSRVSDKALIVADLPFMTYQISVEQAMNNAARLIQEAGAGAVKMEGGKSIIPQVKAIVEAGIPVMGHLGLTPQSINQLGDYKVQAKSKEAALRLIEDARLLEEAGVFALVLETIPMEIARIVSKELKIPVIGIGAGPYCDGQVLVFHDLLGFDDQFKPKFLRKYNNLGHEIKQSLTSYLNDLDNNTFPDDSESYHLNQDVYQEIKKELSFDEDS